MSKILQGTISLFVFGIITALMSQQGSDWGFTFSVISVIIWILVGISILVLIAERKKQPKKIES